MSATIAVRTPMQWTAERNGGFSRARPSRVLRPVTKGPFGPEHGNVADAGREQRVIAQVALAGPLLGTVGAAGLWAIGAALNSRFLTALAFVGFLINLFNLLPVVPLDGGRAAAALHPALWIVGLAGLAALTWFFPNPIIIIVLVIGGMEAWQRWQARRSPGAKSYYAVRPWQRAAVGAVYLGLAGFLVVAMHLTHVPRHF